MVCVVLHANRIEAVPPQRIPYHPLMPGLAYWRKETKRPYRLTLVLRSLASGSERSVPTEFIDTAGVSWSADSLSLLLSAQVPDGWGYYRIDPSSGTATLLRKLGATYDHNPSRDVTKDGKAIYGHVEEKQLHVSIGDPAAGTERELFQTPMASEKGLALRVSPDEGRLALIADEGHTVSVMSMAGEDRREIYRVAPPYTIGNLRW